MKILLLGDFSAVHVNLKQGLEQLGHEVMLVSKGDGFKKLPADVSLYTRQKNGGRFTGVYKEIKDQLRILPRLKNHDIVQTASYQFFHNRIDGRLFKRVIESNHRSVLLNTACSLPYNLFVRGLEYSPCAQCKQYDLHQQTCVHEQQKQQQKEQALYERYSAIVSTHFEYYESMQQTAFSHKNHFIPLPLNVHDYEPEMPPVNGRVTIYYGEIRKGFKGGAYIEQALDKLAASPMGKYAEIIRTSRIPFSEYLNILDRAHILIDQASSYSYGMNALIGLAKGKIVLTGAEPQSMQILGHDQEMNPFFNIRPDSNSIYQTLASLIGQAPQFGAMSEKSRRFVEQHHSVEKVAARYNNLYQQLQ